MNHVEGKTMREVVAQLRAGAAEALLELFELHIALGELVLNAQVLSAVTAEVAEEMGRFAGEAEPTSRERLQEVAKVASKASGVAELQAKALSEIQRGLEGWNITHPGPRLV